MNLPAPTHRPSAVLSRLTARPILPLSLFFLSCFLLYLKTLSPSLYADDSGETATVCALLGIGHPPGYPLHTLLGRLFFLLFPGSAAFSLNLFSALLAAISAALMAGMAAFKGLLPYTDKGGTPWLAALCAGIWLATGSIFWHQALVAKGSIYMLNNLLTFLICLCLWRKTASTAALRFFWLLLGLALAHHYMSQLVLFPAYWAAAFLAAGRRRSGPGFWRDCWLIIPGVSLYAYLPLRSALSPAINWGHIASLNDFAFFLLRRQYSASELSGGFTNSLNQAGAILAFFIKEAGPAGFLYAALGVGWMWKQKHPTRWVLTLAQLVPALGAAVYFNLPPERFYVMMPHLFPALIFLPFLAACGLAWLAARFSRFSWVAYGLAFIGLAHGLWANLPKTDLSANYLALDNARNVLAGSPRRAVLFAAGDSLIFPLWYLQEYCHVRPDVALVGTPVLPMRWVREDLARQYPDLRQPQVNGEIGAESIPPLVNGMLRLNLGRLPLFMTHNSTGPELKGFTLAPFGMLFQPLPENARMDAAERLRAVQSLFKAYFTRGIYGGSLDERSRSLFINDTAVYHNSTGTWVEERGMYAEALDQYCQAARIDPRAREFPYNAGNACFLLGDYGAALSWYRQSLQRDPAYVDAHYNLAVTYFKTGRNDGGRQELEEVLRLDPGRKEVRAQLGK